MNKINKIEIIHFVLLSALLTFFVLMFAQPKHMFLYVCLLIITAILILIITYKRDMDKKLNIRREAVQSQRAQDAER